jgi:hypothetical protein
LEFFEINFFQLLKDLCYLTCENFGYMTLINFQQKSFNSSTLAARIELR